MNAADLEPLPLLPCDRPGPFHVELFECGAWDYAETVPTLVEAARRASAHVRRNWVVHGRQERVRVLDGDGREC